MTLFSRTIFLRRRMPYLSRVNYRHEVRTAATYPLAAAMAEGSFASVVAQKYFQASPALIAVIVAAPMFGNVLALVWADLAERRPKVRFINALQVGVIICTALVSLTWLMPLNVGAWIFALLMVAARLFASGIVTTKSVIWRLNFPKHSRGFIVGRVTMISSGVLAVTTMAASSVLDRHPGSYGLIYLASAALGLIGVRQYAKVRVRGERFYLANAQRRPRLHPLRHLVELAKESVRVLRDDRHFRVYQRCQMLQGVSFMMMLPALFSMVNQQMTRPDGQYNLATFIVHVLPFTITTFSIPLWSLLFDRMNIVRFRWVQSLTALITHAVLMTGALTDQLWLVAVGTFSLGVSSAGGNLAWNLGQYAFAPPEKVGTYMGVHVMLTGVRGLFAPFLGIMLFGGVALGALQWAGIGRYSFVVTTLVCLSATVGYTLMLFDRTAILRDAEADAVPPAPQPDPEGTD